MCGIAGKISFGKRRFVNNDELIHIKKTVETLHHRGPDDSGYYLDSKIWLASTRLSILDKSQFGHQPMLNNDGSKILVFNGEIYNYLELKDKLKKRHRFRSNTDTEVILHLYEDFGYKCLNYLRGMFAFAIWDKKRQELFIARDRIGKKPVKYFYNDKFFIFASELKAFINHPGVPKEIDYDAIDQFLSYQYVPSPRTGFKNIWKLPPAHYMRVMPDGSVKITRYWKLDFSQKLDLSEEEWQERIEDKLRESVRLRLRSDVPLGIHLSGGIDSGLIAAIASIESKRTLKTFSVGFSNKDYNELPYARLISKIYKTDHSEIIVGPKMIEILPELVYEYEEPFADPSIIPTWFLMNESKKKITVALNGDGGDENFAGYRRYKIMNLLNKINYIPLGKSFKKILLIMTKIINSKNISRLYDLNQAGIHNHDIRKLYFEILSIISTGQKKKLYTEKFYDSLLSNCYDYFNNLFKETDYNSNLLDRLLYVDIKSYLPETLMTKIDIASMAHSMEIRSPFLDQEFMEMVATIPSGLKMRNFQTKYILKKMASKYLPKECIYRKKQGFVPPIGLWFRHELKEYLYDQLTDSSLYRFGIFNKGVIENMIKQNQLMYRDNTYALWTILCLKNWLDVWFN